MTARVVMVFEFREHDRLGGQALAEMWERALVVAQQIGGSSLWPTLAEFRVEQ